MSRSAHLIQMLDSTIVRAQVSAGRRKRGQHGQALGRSRAVADRSLRQRRPADASQGLRDKRQGQQGDQARHPWTTESTAPNRMPIGR